MLPRLLRIVNIAIAVVIVLLVAAVYWYVYRPLPKVSGTIAAPVQKPATVQRDERGVPHIEAASWQDALFLQGYVTAQDRLWQMDSLRRFGAGELAEVFGKQALDQDRRSRRMQLRAIAEASIAKLPAGERGVLDEYSRGVNYFIRTHRGNYGVEFSLPGHSYDPRPWTPADSLLIGLVMFRDQTDGSTMDLDRGTLFSHARNLQHLRHLFPAVQGAMVNPASNAWAISGARTADGKPILANDPHLNYGIPSTWYLVHIKAPGLDVSGVSLPGVPCVLAGHNESIAWGFTSLEADVMDLYREQIDLRTGRYSYNGQSEQAELDREVIGVSGAAPVNLDIWVTRHGPVLEAANGGVYSMTWTAQQGVTFPFWDIDRAGDWTTFQTAARKLAGPALNFVYADTAGNIGYQVAGLVPIRNGFDGETPLDGTVASTQWAGFIPAEELPHFFNPTSGSVATANQDPFPPDYRYSVPGYYHGPYRIDQILARLRAKPKLNAKDMLAIQTDVYSAYDFFLARQALDVIAHTGPADDLTRQAAEVLRKWNGQMDKNEAAPVITELLGDAIGRELVRSNANVPDDFRAPAPRPEVIQRILEQRPSGWVAKDDWNTFLAGQLSSALNVARARLGTPVSHWQWGHILQWDIQHPIGKQIPFADRFFDIGPIGMSGSYATVKQTLPNLGPSERMVVDLGDLDASVQNLPTGESGAVASRHYKDQWPAYYAGTSFPMEFYKVNARETLHVEPGKALQ